MFASAPDDGPSMFCTVNVPAIYTTVKLPLTVRVTSVPKVNGPVQEAFSSLAISVSVDSVCSFTRKIAVSTFVVVVKKLVDVMFPLNVPPCSFETVSAIELMS